MATAFFILTAVVVAAAIAAIALAWRVLARERLRSEARVAHLAARIRDPQSDHASSPVAVQPLFAPAAAESSRSLWLGLGVSVAAAVALALVVTVLRPVDASPPKASPQVGAGASALELVALRDERSSDGLTIHGVVRNPARGQEIDHIVAVVLVFNDHGGFLTSARAALEAPALAPGGESSFAVTIPDAAAVGRYRVSFRDDARVIPHVDRRQT
jgi:hypothetical protein